MWLLCFFTRTDHVVPDEIVHVNLRKGIERVDGVVGYRICLTHRRSSVRTWVDSIFCTLDSSGNVSLRTPHHWGHLIY